MQERTARGQCLEQRQHSRYGILEGIIQRQELSGDLGPDCPEIIAILDMTVCFEQITDRQVGGGLAV